MDSCSDVTSEELILTVITNLTILSNYVARHVIINCSITTQSAMNSAMITKI